MADLPGETLRQVLALGLVAVFVAAVRLVDRRYTQSMRGNVLPLGSPAHGAHRLERVLHPQAGRNGRGGEMNMRHALVPSILLASLLVAVARPVMAEPAGGEVRDTLRAAIVDVGMVGPASLRVTVATSGLAGSGGDLSTVTLSARVDGVPIQAALPFVHMPGRFAMDIDLAEGIVRAGGVGVGTFAPVSPLRENLRFPLEVTIHRGAAVATASRTAVIPLPTVLVPGYMNEWGGPSAQLLETFRRHGYTVSGPGQNLFWFTYPSGQATVPEGAAALAAYVRGVVLPATHAARINIIGYSLGGLLARWNVAYDVDGWGALVNRLALVGVPNEGTVMAYLAAHAPSVLPFAGLGHRPAAAAFLPTFPFWRADAAEPWTIPADVDNQLLAGLNARPIPQDVRVYVFYGSNDPRRTGGPQTSAGLTGEMPGSALSYGEGDGVVLSASALGLAIRGGAGVPALTDRDVVRVDLGAVYHSGLLEAASDKLTGALLDRFADRAAEVGAPSN